jgi:hypothetical protein
MNSERDRWNKIRGQAQGYLSADFAKRVVREARDNSGLGRREYMLIGITAAACLMLVAVANWYVGNFIQERNLARWRVAITQTAAIQTSI